MSSGELSFNEAVGHYLKSLEADRAIPTQLSESRSYRENGCWRLMNANGLLAIVRDDGTIVEDEDAA